MERCALRSSAPVILNGESVRKAGFKTKREVHQDISLGQTGQRGARNARNWQEKADLYKGGLCGDALSLGLGGPKVLFYGESRASINASGEIAVREKTQRFGAGACEQRSFAPIKASILSLKIAVCQAIASKTGARRKGLCPSICKHRLASANSCLAPVDATCLAYLTDGQPTFLASGSARP